MILFLSDLLTRSRRDQSSRARSAGSLLAYDTFWVEAEGGELLGFHFASNAARSSPMA
jgi:hypothetical protein